ncbi:hypothetical protein LOTGIDRAFT_184794 [Lottia gigantea]|uniref:tRNA (guanine(26)-N(2))-dimethyltransferase n=1 Tax=Lottia gigantea TaxID=225164 RepID=V4B394_LOTGI|nr:hypothetical protein LOTGIDRAFT_184794 [Lottia gigantea]ESP04823.1 hypothetical protein LOTGIDRAFT_184794 [Lottia gigantea]
MSAPTTKNEKEQNELKYVEERGIKIKNEVANIPSERSKLHNPKMAICREMTLLTLMVAVKDSKIKLGCLEGVSSSGLAALQWKKMLKDKIDVTAATLDCLDSINVNCKNNYIHPIPFPLDFTRTPGITLPQQGEKEIHVCQARTNVLLHMEAFDFIFLDPHKSCTSYIDSVFVNLRHLGILCLIVPDISMFARSHQVVERMYSAAVIKTDYIKELAARVILGKLARSASQCNKGLEVLYTQSVDDFLLLCVKVHRGPHIADASNQNLRSVLHCRMCEERVILEKQKAPVENPYLLLPCTCNKEKIGKTAVVLGPIWAGPIFKPDFLVKMKNSSESLNLDKKSLSVLNAILDEVEDSIETRAENSECNEEEVVDKDTKCDQNTKQTENESVTNKNLESYTTKDNREHNGGTQNLKRPLDDNENSNSPTKRPKRVDLKNKSEKELWDHHFIPFYYNTHRWKMDAAKKLPKLAELIQLLKSDGFRASRTHFDSKCIRTDASLKQIAQTLKSHCNVYH